MRTAWPTSGLLCVNLRRLFTRSLMSALFDSARFVMSVSELMGLHETELPEIAFAGRSNAGKSTTINVLCRQSRLAFSSKTPGRTQLLNFSSSRLREKNRDKEFPNASLSTCRATATQKPPPKRVRTGKASSAATSSKDLS